MAGSAPSIYRPITDPEPPQADKWLKALAAAYASASYNQVKHFQIVEVRQRMADNIFDMTTTTTTIFKWFQQLERAWDLYDLKDMDKMALACSMTEGQTYDMLQDMKSSSPDYPTFKKKACKKLAPGITPNQGFRDFLHLTQGTHETVIRYRGRLEDGKRDLLFGHTSDFCMKVLKGHFSEGLRTEIKDRLDQNPGIKLDNLSLTELEEWARWHENCISKENRQRTQTSELETPITVQGSCNLCQNPGHTTSQCDVYEIVLRNRTHMTTPKRQKRKRFMKMSTSARPYSTVARKSGPESGPRATTDHQNSIAANTSPKTTGTRTPPRLYPIPPLMLPMLGIPPHSDIGQGPMPEASKGPNEETSRDAGYHSGVEINSHQLNDEEKVRLVRTHLSGLALEKFDELCCIMDPRNWVEFKAAYKATMIGILNPQHNNNPTSIDHWAITRGDPHTSRKRRYTDLTANNDWTTNTRFDTHFADQVSQPPIQNHQTTHTSVGPHERDSGVSSGEEEPPCAEATGDEQDLVSTTSRTSKPPTTQRILCLTPITNANTGLMVQGAINGYSKTNTKPLAPALMYYDSGASCSVITRAGMERLNIQAEFTGETANISGITPGATTSTIDHFKAQLQIGNWSAPHDFYVIDSLPLKTDIVLGYDVWKKFTVITLLMGEQKMYMEYQNHGEKPLFWEADLFTHADFEELSHGQRPRYFTGVPATLTKSDEQTENAKGPNRNPCPVHLAKWPCMRCKGTIAKEMLCCKTTKGYFVRSDYSIHIGHTNDENADYQFCPDGTIRKITWEEVQGTLSRKPPPMFEVQGTLSRKPPPMLTKHIKRLVPTNWGGANEASSSGGGALNNAENISPPGSLQHAPRNNPEAKPSIAARIVPPPQQQLQAPQQQQPQQQQPHVSQQQQVPLTTETMFSMFKQMNQNMAHLNNVFKTGQMLQNKQAQIAAVRNTMEECRFGGKDSESSAPAWLRKMDVYTDLYNLGGEEKIRLVRTLLSGVALDKFHKMTPEPTNWEKFKVDFAKLFPPKVPFPAHLNYWRLDKHRTQLGPIRAEKILHPEIPTHNYISAMARGQGRAKHKRCHSC